MSAPHPVVEVEHVEATISFLLAEEMRALPVPWPRCQDLARKAFAVPSKDDLVLAVSHCWPYGAHPDPAGNKSAAISNLIDEACGVHHPKGKTLMFADFLSVSQRPFAAWQKDRTPEEEVAFGLALRAFPQIYLQADAVLHIDVPMHRVDGDGQEYYASLDDLEGVTLRLLGTTVHVVSVRDPNASSLVAPFDIVERVNEVDIASIDDVERARTKYGRSAAAGSAGQSMWPWCCSASSASSSNVRMRRAPFGIWSSLSADQKGWVFLERFASMVKAALVPEDQAPGVAFATSAQLKGEILLGGRRLREAAALGQESLAEALQEYLTQLDGKLFSAVSIDKATNTGGLGGAPNAEPDAEATASIKDVNGKVAEQDRDVVAVLMRELVDYLQQNWPKEQQAQRQRQLVLAVSRGDVASCRQLIAAGADPNAQDTLGLTSLHSAARLRDLDVTRLLIEEKANLLLQDIEGNCAAHRLGLYAQDVTVRLFEALAPTLGVLSLPNNAGVMPFNRFVAWAVTAVDSKPFPPANALIEELRRRYPSLCKKKAAAGPLAAAGGLAGKIKEEVVDHTFDGHTLKLRRWQDPKVAHQIEILYVGWPVYLPWCLQEPAVRVLANHWCSKYPCRVTAMSVDDLAAGLMKPLGEVLDFMARVLAGLPIGRQFYLVDNTAGFCTPVAWKLQDRLRGVVVLNTLGWFADDFYMSEGHQGMLKFAGKHADLFAQHDVEGPVGLVGSFVYVESAEDCTEVLNKYAAALKTAPDNFWTAASQLARLVLREATPLWQAQVMFSASIPVVLACGAFSPSLLVQETMVRIKSIAPGSQIHYIPDSKQWWEVEGEAQTMSVANLLAGMLK